MYTIAIKTGESTTWYHAYIGSLFFVKKTNASYIRPFLLCTD